MITLSDELGKLTVKTTGGKKSAQLINLLLPAAQVGIIAEGAKKVGSVVFWPINRYVEGNMGLQLVKDEFVSLSPGERVAKYAQGMAGITAEVAGAGCALAVTNGGECIDGATIGAEAGFATGIVVFGAGTIIVHGSDLASKLATKINAIKPFAKVAGAPQMLKDLNIAEVAGVLGVAAVTAKYFEPSVFSKGGRMVCSSKKDYRFESLSGEVLYAVGDIPGLCGQRTTRGGVLHRYLA